MSYEDKTTDATIEELLSEAAVSSNKRKRIGKISWFSKKVTAPSVTAKQIVALQNNELANGRYLVLDVRSVTESDVSVLPGAIAIAEFERTVDQHQSKTIITYCTIGVRSGWYANRLKTHGWNAYNYKGSIIDWCKNGLPLVTPQGEATNRVHTYNRMYSVPAQYEAVP